MDFVLRSAPKRRRDEVYVVSGDGFFNNDLLASMNLPNAIFILDYFHLFDSILPKLFEKYFDHLEPYLRKMIDSKTETDFDTCLQ